MATWLSLLTALAALFGQITKFFGANRERHYQLDQFRTKAKAASHDLLIKALRARRKARIAWDKSRDNNAARPVPSKLPDNKMVD